jgi:hypothetical protein
MLKELLEVIHGGLINSIFLDHLEAAHEATSNPVENSLSVILEKVLKIEEG